MRLQTKILAGYLVLVAVICSMAGEIQEIRRDITVAQRSITTLATLGEGIIGWEEADKAYWNKGKTDFSKQVKIARAILKKANML